MRIKQLSIFMENRAGRLAKITTSLGEAGVNIEAMSLADTSDFGIFRLIASDTDKAREVLKAEGFTVNVTDVVAVEISDSPGALGRLLTEIDGAGLNVEYMYIFEKKKHMDNAVLILRFEDLDRATEKLTELGIRVLDANAVQE